MPRMNKQGYAPISARSGTDSPVNSVHFAKIDSGSGIHHTMTLSRPRPPVPPRYHISTITKLQIHRFYIHIYYLSSNHLF